MYQLGLPSRGLRTETSLPHPSFLPEIGGAVLAAVGAAVALTNPWVRASYP